MIDPLFWRHFVVGHDLAFLAMPLLMYSYLRYACPRPLGLRDCVLSTLRVGFFCGFVVAVSEVYFNAWYMAWYGYYGVFQPTTATVWALIVLFAAEGLLFKLYRAVALRSFLLYVLTPQTVFMTVWVAAGFETSTLVTGPSPWFWNPWVNLVEIAYYALWLGTWAFAVKKGTAEPL